MEGSWSLANLDLDSTSYSLDGDEGHSIPLPALGVLFTPIDPGWACLGASSLLAEWEPPSRDHCFEPKELRALKGGS